MKRILSLILALVMCLGLCACGGNGAAEQNTTETTAQPTTTPETSTEVETETPVEPETYYNIGDTVSTNLFNFTLDKATLAIALENTVNDNYCEPREYDPQRDNKNPYVAPTGHTYAAFTYTIENISRSHERFHDGNFVKVTYKGTEYDCEMDDCAILYYQVHQYYYNGKLYTDAPNTWHSCSVAGVSLGATEKLSCRSYAEFAVEADSLTDGFYLSVSVPSTQGEEVFIYQIPAAK